MIEILIVVGIMGLILGIISFSFASQTSTRSVEGEALAVLTSLDQARALAMNGRNNTDYGIHFATSTKTLFIGNIYDAASTTNQVENVAAGVQIVDISLNGGGSTVVFDRLTGRTSDYGTIKVQSSSDINASTTITIYQTGLNEIE